MTHELKPCPFCGNDGKGGIEEALHVSGDPSTGYCVQCDKCTATMGHSYSADDDIDDQAAAIEAWNTRAEAQPSADVKAQQIVDIFDMHAQFYVDHAGAGKPIKIENAMEVAQKILGLLAPQPSADVVERVARFQEALEDIAASHVPDQPAESAAEPEVFVRMWVGRLRGIATEALKQQPQESAE